MSAPQNISNGTWGVGVTGRGYCFLHDRDYFLKQGDEVCPQCPRWKERDLAWRDAEDSNYTAGDDMGDANEK